MWSLILIFCSDVHLCKNIQLDAAKICNGSSTDERLCICKWIVFWSGSAFLKHEWKHSILLGVMKEHNYRAPIKVKAPPPHAFLNIFADLFRASEAMRDWCSIHQILTINWTIGALFENFVEPKSRGRHCLLDRDMTVKLPNQNLKLLIVNRELDIFAGLNITQMMLSKNLNFPKNTTCSVVLTSIYSIRH